MNFDGGLLVLGAGGIGTALERICNRNNIVTTVISHSTCDVTVPPPVLVKP